MVGETRENFFRFTSMDGPHFTVYGLFRDPKLYRTVIFRHAERGLGTTLRIDGSDPGPLNVRLEPMATLSGRLLEEVGGNRARVSSFACCGSFRSHTSGPPANSHHLCARRLTGTAGSASTASYRELPTGCRRLKASFSTATSGHPGRASRRTWAIPRSTPGADSREASDAFWIAIGTSAHVLECLRTGCRRAVESPESRAPASLRRLRGALECARARPERRGRPERGSLVARPLARGDRSFRLRRVIGNGSRGRDQGE